MKGGTIRHFHGSFRTNWHLTKAEIASLPTAALERRSQLLQHLIGSDLETMEILQEYDLVWDEIAKRKESLI